MDKADDSIDLYRLADWYQVNRKALIAVVVVVVAVGAAIGLYLWHQKHNEMSANDALSNLKFPAAESMPTAAEAEPFLKVAEDYSGTTAAARALLIGGGIQFGAGKFDQSKATFEKFLQQYSDSPLANQAALGVAASLEAQGKTAEAASRYADVLKRPFADAVMPQAQSALARCDLALNKPDQALHLYEELARVNNNDTWSMEAKIQAHEVLVKYPELAKPKAPVPTATLPTAMPMPSVKK